MKLPTASLPAAAALVLLMAGTGCTSTKQSATPPQSAASVSGTKKSAKADDKAVRGTGADALDDYGDAVVVSDPIEPFNRGTFWVNHQIYRYIFKPVAKVYEFVVPDLLRKGVHNAFENVRYPVRVVNDGLQGNFPRAGQETGRFLVNSTLGVGGLFRASDKFPALANVPPGDTAQTFAKWKIPTGPYFVVPILGPSTARDVVGLAGDYALNPINWVSIVFGGYTWTLAIPSANSLRSMPVQVKAYEAATDNSLDRYLAARTAYAQYRKQVESR